MNGYMIEVRGYASTTGSAALNQKLSQNRAENVVNLLLQQGHVPLARMLAPGAMGETGGKDETAADEAQAVTAVGHWVHVYVDRTSRKPVPIPDAIRSLLSTACVEPVDPQ